MNYATKGSAGLDLIAQEQVTIKAHSNGCVNVGKVLGIPSGWVGLIMPKSGLSIKHDIVERLGVVDCDYTGDVICKLDNLSDVDFTFNAGDRVAQMVVVEFFRLCAYGVKDVERGERGFGECDAE